MPVKGTHMQDSETRTMLYEGASISQLGKLFIMDNRTVSAKLHAVLPVGKRHGSPIYLIRDAAPHLCKPLGDITEAIKRMHHSELPPLVQKEFWNGLRARQEYEKAQGMLWATSDIIDSLAEAFKLLRMSLLLTRDRVERESELTGKQREIIQSIIDGALIDLNKALIERFQNDPDRKFDNDKIVNTSPAAKSDEEDPAADL